MTEALSSLDQAFLHSPHTISQEDDSQPQFIQGKKDIIRDLVKSNPIELFFDAISLYQDFLQAIVEDRQLVKDPIYDGEGVPRGDGSKYLFMGGFATWPWMFNDGLRTSWKIGYEAKAVWSGPNIGPIRQTAKRLLAVIREEAKESGGKVNVAGQSLGGLNWAAAFMENPEMFIEYVDHVIFGVSPRPTRVNKALGIAYLITQWFVSEDGYDVGNRAELLKRAQDDGLIKVTSIDASTDPVIQGHFLGRDEGHYVVEYASHSGLGNNRDFFRTCAYRLAGEEIDGVYPHIHRASKAA